VPHNRYKPTVRRLNQNARVITPFTIIPVNEGFSKNNRGICEILSGPAKPPQYEEARILASVIHRKAV
jgi:hypothetical protein